MHMWQAIGPLVRSAWFPRFKNDADERFLIAAQMIIARVYQAKQPHAQIDRVEQTVAVALAAKPVSAVAKATRQEILLNQRFADTIHDKVDKGKRIMGLFFQCLNREPGAGDYVAERFGAVQSPVIAPQPGNRSRTLDWSPTQRFDCLVDRIPPERIVGVRYAKRQDATRFKDAKNLAQCAAIIGEVFEHL
jgi:hypothetical protein